MPAGSVDGKVVRAKLDYPDKVTSLLKSGTNHLPILEALCEFAKGQKTLTLELDNEAKVVIGPSLELSFEPRNPGESGKIVKAVLWRMRDEAHYSRNNQTSPGKWAEGEGDPVKILVMLGEFSVCPVRCMLHLESDKGPEIDIYPCLKPEVPAFNEFGSSIFDYKAQPNWDMRLTVWPMLEEWLGVQAP